MTEKQLKLWALAEKFYNENESPDPEEFSVVFQCLVEGDLKSLCEFMKDLEMDVSEEAIQEAVDNYTNLP